MLGFEMEQSYEDFPYSCHMTHERATEHGRMRQALTDYATLSYSLGKQIICT